MNAQSVGTHDEWAQSLVRQTHQSGDVILSIKRDAGTPSWVTEKLYGAYCHLFAAMYADFVAKAESEIILADGIKMQDGTVKSVREFLMDDICRAQLSQLEASTDPRFASRIREKLEKLCAAMPQKASAEKE